MEKAGNSKRKRSLADVNHNHKRWLEDEWRDDYHYGGLSRSELHKRWFGSDVIDWLKGLLNKGIKSEFTHDIDQTFTAIILREKWNCDVSDVKISASLDATASAEVKVSTTFGFTLITTLRLPLDLSNSYLYFKNKGEVDAVFTLSAHPKARFESGDFELANIPFPGAGFRIPKLLAVGPTFRLTAAAEAEVALAGKLEARVQIAAWDVQQTYPDQNPEWNPKSLSQPLRNSDRNGLSEPEFDFSVVASGQLTAHLKPAVTFGIMFDEAWKIGAAKAEVVADGFVRVYAQAELSSSGGCPFKYGLDAGARLIARAEAPSAFSWKPAEFVLADFETPLISGGTCPEQRLTERRMIDGLDAGATSSTLGYSDVEVYNASSSAGALAKRDTFSYGPIFSVPIGGTFCPNPKPQGALPCAEIKGWDDDEVAEVGFRKRHLSTPFNPSEKLHPTDRSNVLEKRSRDKKKPFFCPVSNGKRTTFQMRIFSAEYGTCGNKGDIIGVSLISM